MNDKLKEDLRFKSDLCNVFNVLFFMKIVRKLHNILLEDYQDVIVLIVVIYKAL